MHQMKPGARLAWDGSELAHCFPVGSTSDLALVLRDLRTGEFRLRIVSPEAETRIESAPLVVGGRLQACDLTQDGARLFWYDGDDLRAVDVDACGAADVADQAWAMAGHTLASLSAIASTRVVLCRAGQFPPVLCLDLAKDAARPFEPAHRPVTQLAPRFAASPGGAWGAFGYVFDAVEIFELAGSGRRPWPHDEQDPEVLAGSPFIAGLYFSADARVLAVSSGPGRDGSGRSRLRIAGRDGAGPRDLDTSSFRKEMGVLPDLAHAITTAWEPTDRACLLDLSTGSIAAEASVGFAPRAIVVSGDGGTCYFAAKGEARAFHLE